MKSLRVNLAMVAAALLAALVAANAQALDVFTFGGVNADAPMGTPDARVGPYFGTLATYQNDDGLVWRVDLIGRRAWSLPGSPAW